MSSPATVNLTLPNVASADDIARLERKIDAMAKLIELLAVKPDVDGLLDRPAAAKFLAIGLSTLDGLAIPHLKIGSAVRYRRESLEDWAKSKEQAA